MPPTSIQEQQQHYPPTNGHHHQDPMKSAPNGFPYYVPHPSHPNIEPRDPRSEEFNFPVFEPSAPNSAHAFGAHSVSSNQPTINPPSFIPTQNPNPNSSSTPATPVGHQYPLNPWDTELYDAYLTFHNHLYKYTLRSQDTRNPVAIFWYSLYLSLNVSNSICAQTSTYQYQFPSRGSIISLHNIILRAENSLPTILELFPVAESESVYADGCTPYNISSSYYLISRVYFSNSS